MRRVLGLMIGILVPFVVSQAATAEDQWLCKAEQASGFAKSDGEDWQAASFTSERQLVLKRASAEDITQVVELVDTRGASLPFGSMPVFVVKQGEEQLPIASCPMELKDGQTLLCKGPWSWTTFYFSAETGRYLYVSPLGFWDVKDGDTDHPSAGQSPFSEIGSCKKF